jgi:xanthine/CO dehydrogenase XdhC/CoxF family maturation factor
MRELSLILEAARRLRTHGEEAVLATVVKVEGSTYRRPGARLLVTRCGEATGGVSGGCLEGDLVRKAWWRTEDGPVVVRYDSTADAETAWQLGLGCNGVVHVLLERLSPTGPDPLAFVRRCVESGETGVLATVIRADAATGLAVGGRLTLDSDGVCESCLGSDELAAQVRADAEECLVRERGRAEAYSLPGGEAEVTFEVVRPPVRLLVFGAGFDAAPVVAAAKALGWHVTVIDRRPGAAHRPTFAAADAFVPAPAWVACERVRFTSRTAAVVMGHNFPDDRNAVAALLRSDCRYVGVLGPSARTEKILAEIPDLEPEALDRLYAPVGLDVGAEGPEEIAAAVVAEVMAVFAERSGGLLRDRPGPIHRREAVRPAGALS